MSLTQETLSPRTPTRSLLDVLNETKPQTEEEKDELEKIIQEHELPEIDIEECTLDELESFILKCNYLCIQDTKKYIDEYIWRIGEKEKLFFKIFSIVPSTSNGVKYYNKCNSLISLEVNRYYPGGCNESLGIRFGNVMYTDLEQIVCYRNLKLLKYIIMFSPNRDMITYYATKYRYLDILEWAADNGCIINCDVPENAIASGYLEILEWYIKRGYSLFNNLCDVASKFGRLDMLKLLRKNNCKWDEWVCIYAAENGHLDVIKWAVENGCPIDKATRDKAIKNGYSNIVDWFDRNNCPNFYIQTGRSG